jgi:hypothetical protein
MPFMDKTTSS